MSEKTANAGHNNNPEICFGMMTADEKGKVKIPPEYAYKIEFNDKDCLVIPLEGSKTRTRKTTKSKTTKEDRAHE